MSKPIKRKLTDREEEFCQLIARRGYNQTDAYIEAYGIDGTRKSARELASRVMKKDHIIARIDSLKSRFAYIIDWDKKKSEDQVKDIMQKATKVGNLKVALACVQELNKMCGLYAPQTTMQISASIADKDARDMLSELGYVKKELPASYEVVE